ncbi:MAG: CopG family transcriptional regulator [Rhodoplanes sp.]
MSAAPACGPDIRSTAIAAGGRPEERANIVSPLFIIVSITIANVLASVVKAQRVVLRNCHLCNTFLRMKTLTVRLPDDLASQIEAESRHRKMSKSDVIRERLTLAAPPRRRGAAREAIADLIGSVKGLPTDLSVRTKDYLRATGYGRKRPR